MGVHILTCGWAAEDKGRGEQQAYRQYSPCEEARAHAHLDSESGGPAPKVKKTEEEKKCNPVRPSNIRAPYHECECRALEFNYPARKVERT